MKALKFYLFFVFCIVLQQFSTAYGARILFVAFFEPRSHKIAYDPLIQELAKRGHQVTTLTSLKPKANTTNPRELTTFDYEDFMLNDDNAVNLYEIKAKGETPNPANFLHVFKKFCRMGYQSDSAKMIAKEKFDLILYEGFFNECALGYIHLFNTSTIQLFSMTTPTEYVREAGGYVPISFVPNTRGTLTDRMSFYERIQNFVHEILIAWHRNFLWIPTMEALYRELLNDTSLPGCLEITGNKSLTMASSHFALNSLRPHMPDIIEVGGMHMRNTKPLPKELEEFIADSGEDGFIYFSMGTILHHTQLPETHRKIFLQAFSRLKQKVIWKWESESMPDLPPNVKLIKWAPQQDILAHPKIKVFIMHGGLGGTTESIYQGVPMIGIPIFADQLVNVAKCVKKGISLELDFQTLSVQDIEDAINTMLTDLTYRSNAQRLSRIFRDQQENPLEKAVFWVEYVLRHEGAIHLRSPSKTLNFFQYHSLDTITTLVIILVMLSFICYKILKFIATCFCGIVFGRKHQLHNVTKKNK